MISKRIIGVKPYKMSSDSNAAPCIKDNTLSFGICMRPMRNTAEKGDIIFAFSAPGLKATDYSLLYVWVVEETLLPCDYYGNRSAGRDDDIYEMIKGKFERKLLAFHHNWYYHGKGIPHPIYKNTLYLPNHRGVADPLPALIQESTEGDGVNLNKPNILISKNYKHFRSAVHPSASDGSGQYKSQFPLVAALVPEIRQMHRTDISDDLRAELLALARLHLPHPEAVPNY